MESFRLVISPAARDDLTGIFSCGLMNWGRVWTGRYLDTLRQSLWTLTLHPAMGIERTEILSGLRSFPINNHVVFYRIRSDCVEIIRILHSRQDIPGNLR